MPAFDEELFGPVAALIDAADAEEAIARWQALQGELAGDDQTLRGEISLFCSVTAATSILPPLLRTFRMNHPGVQIKLQTGDAAEALDRLTHREVEVTIAASEASAAATILARANGR